MSAQEVPCRTQTVHPVSQTTPCPLDRLWLHVCPEGPFQSPVPLHCFRNNFLHPLGDLWVSVSSGCPHRILDSLYWFQKPLFLPGQSQVCTYPKAPCGLSGAFPVSEVTFSTTVGRLWLYILPECTCGIPTPLHYFRNSFILPIGNLEVSISSGDLLPSSGPSMLFQKSCSVCWANCRSVPTWEAPC